MGSFASPFVPFVPFVLSGCADLGGEDTTEDRGFARESDTDSMSLGQSDLPVEMMTYTVLLLASTLGNENL